MPQKLISKERHAKLLAAARKAAHKNRDRLASAKSIVSVWVLKELRFEVSDEASEAWDNVNDKPAGKGRSNNVASPVSMLKYIEALKAYEPSEDVVEDLFEETFSTETTNPAG